MYLVAKTTIKTIPPIEAGQFTHTYHKQILSVPGDALHDGLPGQSVPVSGQKDHENIWPGRVRGEHADEIHLLWHPHHPLYHLPCDQCSQGLWCHPQFIYYVICVYVQNLF